MKEANAIETTPKDSISIDNVVNTRAHRLLIKIKKRFISNEKSSIRKILTGPVY
jgi:hypothetical protein